MKAAVMIEPEVIQIQDLPIPKVSADGVLIEIHAVGLCGSDLTVFKGQRAVGFPHVLGHEASGKVVKVGPAVKKLKVGDRVAIEPNFRCGVCEICRRGTSNLCPSKETLGLTLPGCFAEYVKVAEPYAWKIPDSMSYLEGALVEPASVAVHAVNNLGIRLGDSVLVLGAGPIGLLAMQCARLAGGEVTVSDIATKRLDLAVELGADHISDGHDLRERTFDRIIDAAGMPATFLAALSLVKPGGTAVLIGFGGRPVTVDPTTVVRQEINIKGVMACADEFPRTIELIGKRKLQAKPVASCELKFDEIERGLRLMDDKTAIKPVVLL
ncbi:MAG: alcohol dehydrogenase catalytic domain-containing protein [Firmicutes bacterium]|nr:alcohol dehydrogenase catalytic domain-containing protein [Bacillota bacterium]